MPRYFPSLLLMVLAVMPGIIPSAHAADNRNSGLTFNNNANPTTNRIDGLFLSTTTASTDSAVRVTIMGTGSCLTRVDNGGLQTIQGRSYVDLPGGFPKYVSLVVQGAPGSYTIQAQSANPRDTSCTGSASATLFVTGATPNRNTAPSIATAPSNLAIAPMASPATSAARMPVKNAEPKADSPPPPVVGGGVAVNGSNSPGTDLLTPAGAVTSVTSAATKKKTDAYEPGQLVILWDETSEANQGLAILARDYKVQPIQRSDLPNLGGMLATFQLRDNKLAILLRDILRQQYPNWHVDLHARYQSLEGARIYLPTKIDAPATTSLLPKLRIGILDTAVTPIRALQTAKLTQRSFLADADTPALPEHGTAIAALISGQDKMNNFRGLALGAQLFVGAIMRDQAGNSGSNTATLLRGLDWLIGSRVQVINLSLGGPGDDLMASIFAKLQKKGVIIVASAGNGGPDAPPSYPAAYRGVLAVTAVDALDQSYRDANSGRYIAIAAPGVDVWTPDAANGHYVSGTSFSSAVVTGAIGLMLSYKADLTADRVRENLCRHARDLGAPGNDPVYGCGLMQISQTLAALR